MEAAKEQSGPSRFNRSLGRRDSATQDRIMAIATVAQTISGKDCRRKKGPWDPSLRSGLRAALGSVPGAASADYTKMGNGSSAN